MKLLPISVVQECFDCDFATGKLSWRMRPADHFESKRGCNSTNAKFAGRDVAPVLNNRGYRVVGITYQGDARIYLQHRVVFALAVGEWPVGMLDHVDGDRSNNAISNLRRCTMQQNAMNQPGKLPSEGRLKGASFHRRLGKWSSSICFDYTKRHLGYFDTAEEAHAAYRTAATELHGEFARFG